MQLVLGGYLSSKKAYEHTAYFSLEFIWTTKHTHNLMSLPYPLAEQYTYLLIVE